MPKLLVFAFCLVFPSICKPMTAPCLLRSIPRLWKNMPEPVSAERLATSALEGLSAIDRELLFANGKEMIYLYYKNSRPDYGINRRKTAMSKLGVI